MARWFFLVSVVTVASLGVGCSAPGVGEPCFGSPEAGGCADGALCVLAPGGPQPGDRNDPSWDSYFCRARCSRHEDCPAGFSCELVPTTPMLSACQPRSAR